MLVYQRVYHDIPHYITVFYRIFRFYPRKSHAKSHGKNPSWNHHLIHAKVALNTSKFERSSGGAEATHGKTIKQKHVFLKKNWLKKPLTCSNATEGFFPWFFFLFPSFSRKFSTQKRHRNRGPWVTQARLSPFRGFWRLRPSSVFRKLVMDGIPPSRESMAMRSRVPLNAIITQ